MENILKYNHVLITCLLQCAQLTRHLEVLLPMALSAPPFLPSTHPSRQRAHHGGLRADGDLRREGHGQVPVAQGLLGDRGGRQIEPDDIVKNRRKIWEKDTVFLAYLQKPPIFTYVN